MCVEPRLSAAAPRYWDDNVRLLERGVITQGKSGLFRRSRTTLAFAGIHPSQHELSRGHGGLEQYMRDRVEQLLTSVPAKENYFAAQAALGRYLDADHVPPYLLAENFDLLRQMTDRVETVTGSLVEYLDSQPDSSIDKFNLLDIFDWMEAADLQSALRGVLRTGTDGGRFIYRSTVPARLVPPELCENLVSDDDLARDLLTRDRSAAYAGFHIYQITSRSAPAHWITRSRTDRSRVNYPG